jgi:two-component system nitrate/nitrite response regulator NarL
VTNKIPPANVELKVPAQSSAGLPPVVRVWLVDDDAFFSGQCALLLQMESGIVCDYQFLTAEDLIKTLKQMPGPDVILLDHHLPGLSGLDAIPQVKSLSPSTRIFVFSAQYNPHQEKEARARGADHCFSKYDFDLVLEAIRSRQTNVLPQKIV